MPDDPNPCVRRASCEADTVGLAAERVDGKSFDFAPLAQAVTDRLVA